MKPAGHAKRLFAHIIDLFIIGFIWSCASVILMAFAAKIFPEAFESASVELAENGTVIPTSLFFLVLLIVVLFSTIFHTYFIYQETSSGQTVGKKVMNIKVVSLDGSPITRKQAVSRDFSKIYFELMFTLPLLYIFTNEKRQRLGDKWAKTIVIENSQN